MAYGVPAAMLMVPLTWRVLLWLFPPEFESFPISDEAVRDKLAALGPLSGIEWRTLIVFGDGDRHVAGLACSGRVDSRPGRAAD